MVKWGVSEEVAQLDTQAQLQRAAGLQCENVSERVQAILQGASGTNINGRISSINAAKDPSTLMSEAVAAMQDVANMQAVISEELKPLSESCEDIVNSREAVKERIQPIVAQANNGTVPRNGTSSIRSGSAPNQSSIGSQPFGNISSPTHLGNTQSFR